ncbi:hypothetical protein QFZ65_002590 [Arthrobacter sp. B3I9]|nr:hypothetical protein [Arthrobacter sp. B3I9]
MRDGVAFETGLMIETEVLKRFAGRESGGAARDSAPEASLAATSRERTAARYSSWVQPAPRAWSASRAAASRILGAFIAR